MNGFTYYKKKRIRREELKYKLSKRDNRKFDKIRIRKNDNDHFDTVEVCKIEELSILNPISALERLEVYLDKYPRDYYAHALKVNYLIILRRFEEAYELLEYLEYELNRDKKMRKYEDKYDKNINSLDYAKIKYYLYTHNYQKAHDIALCNPVLIGEDLSNRTVLYIKNKLDTCDKMNYFEEAYSSKQILNYSVDRMLRHIRKHLTIGNDGRENPNPNIFVRDFPINEILEEAKKYLIDDNAVYLGLIEDDYYFKYDDCGKENNKFVNYFKIVCFHGTKDIITVLPVAHYNELSYVDLNYMNTNSIDNCKQLVLDNKKDI
jgi:hypothetical protein